MPLYAHSSPGSCLSLLVTQPLASAKPLPPSSALLAAHPASSTLIPALGHALSTQDRHNILLVKVTVWRSPILFLVVTSAGIWVAPGYS